MHEPERRFLDLDDDGLLDAVESSECHTVDLDLDGVPDIIVVDAELEAAIGDDGVPGRVETVHLLMRGE
ncbi:MAG: hypothetical protein WEA81_02040 [Dehalococcoidia bacterium]